MWENEVSIDIARPPEIVYTYLADFQRHSEWSMSVTKLEQQTSGPVGVGTEFKASEVLPAKIVSFARITALEPPNRIAWQSTDYRVFQTQWEFRLGRTAGGTHLTQHVRFQPVSLLGKVFIHLRKRQAPAENLKSLARIKAALEAK